MSAAAPLHEYVSTDSGRFGLTPIPSLTAFMNGTEPSAAALAPPDPSGRVELEPPVARSGPARRVLRRFRR